MGSRASLSLFEPGTSEHKLWALPLQHTCRSNIVQLREDARAFPFLMSTPAPWPILPPTKWVRWGSFAGGGKLGLHLHIEPSSKYLSLVWSPYKRTYPTTVLKYLPPPCKIRNIWLNLDFYALCFPFPLHPSFISDGKFKTRYLMECHE